MDVNLYNTFSRSKEQFNPISKDKVGIYSCGPTVYDTPHIGNYRTFVMNDLLRRMFEYNGYTTKQVMNITDIDDKTIRKSREENLSLKDLAAKYEKLFLDGLESLNIIKPQYIVRATEYISDMIELISTLLEKGVAYKAEDGVYMSIAKIKNYGQLANLDISKISKERISTDDYDKDNPRDFAIWKFRTPEDREISWQSPFGEGRPGWHIECSAMAMKLLGPTIDIHTGGADLIFPHHTNEIAQSESATDKPFVNYWIHGGFITVKKEKMAKSKGLFTKLKDLEDEHISPITYRYWLLTAHYRSPVDFSYEAIRAAQSALLRLLSTFGKYPEGGTLSNSYKKRFQDFINDDLDMPKAIALVWELIKDSNISDADKKATLLDFDRVFGLGLESIPSLTEEEVSIPPEVQALSEARQDARLQKDWVKADALRDEIETRGFTVVDTEMGVKILEV